MNSAFARELRAAARTPLPEGAFLRRDRGEALFVTDAPRRGVSADWRRALGEGWLCRIEGGLAYLSPGQPWLDALEAAHPEPPDFLCASLRRFAGLPANAEGLRLFALGARALDGDPDAQTFDRRLRQRAALCLRAARDPGANLQRSPGGGLYACAIIRHLIEEEDPK